MINKIGKFLRKLHRYITPFFIILTVWVMVINKDPQMGIILAKLQKVFTLALAISGAYLFFQIYYNKNKAAKKRKVISK